jgi:hypothetical protein
MTRGTIAKLVQKKEAALMETMLHTGATLKVVALEAQSFLHELAMSLQSTGGEDAVQAPG